MESYFILMQLPYGLEQLAPYMSKETLEYHYLKHHKTYVDNLNNLLKSMSNNNEISNKPKKTLYELIRDYKHGPIFNNAAQVFNHNFFWNSLTPKGKSLSNSVLKEKLLKKWDSIENFTEAFNKKAMETFGSGWVWLVKTPDGELEILSTPNAETPITGENVPLLTCDVWEHAYYIDYRNSRKAYFEAYWKIVNWNFAEENFIVEREWNTFKKNMPNF
jgi:Fe-Mn family superoxide dismutase